MKQYNNHSKSVKNMNKKAKSAMTNIKATKIKETADKNATWTPHWDE